MKEIGFSEIGGEIDKVQSIPTILSDSKSAIAIAETDSSHGRTKHIDTQYHFIRDKIQAGILKVDWVSTHSQIADILTKALPPRIFVKFQSELVVPTGQSRGGTKENEWDTQSYTQGEHRGEGATKHTENTAEETD